MIRPRLAVALLFVVCAAAHRSASSQYTVLKAPVRNPYLAPGYVSENGVITFEDVATLTPAMRHAVASLRSGDYATAITEFRALQSSEPRNPLAFRGETQAALRLDSSHEDYKTFEDLDRASRRPGPNTGATAKRFTDILAGTRRSSDRAVLEYAVGDALIAARGERAWVAAPRRDLGPEPEMHLLGALRIDPKMLVARLALAMYYDYQSGPSGSRGSSARKQYEAALGLRPDLACKLRFLRALTWVRPGYVTPHEMARLRRQGLTLPEDHRMVPEKTIAECEALIKDYPDYVPAYERLARDYEWPLGNRAMAQKYRTMAEELREKLRTKG